MNLKETGLLFEKGRFSEATEMLLSDYDPGAENRRMGDAFMEAARFWHSHQEKLDQDECPWKLWDEFVCRFYFDFPQDAYEILEACGKFVMKKILIRLSEKPIAPDDRNPFEKKLAFARALMWAGEIRKSHSFCANLARHYPKKAEPWALMGKLYFIMENYPKSLLCYRESFFINPSVLNLMDIHSGVTLKILEFCRNQYMKGQEKPSCGQILQWMGICGVAENFFRTRRELSPEEVQELKKRIEVYENKYRIYKKKEDWLNLIRLYVFQIDYFWAQNQKELVQESLQKLEWLEPMVLQKIKNTRG